MKIDIRESTEDDLPALVELYSEMSGVPMPPDRAGAIYERLRHYPDYRVYVACVDGRVVGTFALLVMDNFARQGTTSAIVEDVVVSAPWRRKGIGRAMMRFAMDRCAGRGCYKMALTSNVNREDAHRFYESLGLRKHGYSFVVAPPANPDR